MTQDPRIGSQIAGFTIVSLIGRGGMGVVYLAQHARLGRRVALKVLPPEMASAQELRRRFVDREPRLAASVEHPNVLPIHDAGEEADGTLWMAMRYVDGKDLGRLLRDEGPLEPARALQLIGQVAEALDAAHAEGLIHRDVKPENILVEGRPPREHVYLTDFGLTRHISSGRLTASGAFLGSIHYASPEVIEGRPDLDGRADVYSLGCVLFQCLTGHVPFAQESDISVLYSHLKAEPPEPASWRPELPARLNDVIRSAMAKRADDRYPTCGSLVEAASAAVSPDSRVGAGTGDSGLAGVRSEAIGSEATSVIDVSAQLIPIESTGRRSARHQVRIENRGRSRAQVHLTTRGRRAISAAVSPGSLVVEPVSVAWAGVRVRPRNGRLIGRRRLPFQVIVEPEGADAITLGGVLIRPAPVVAWSVITSLVLVLGGSAAFLAFRPHPRNPPARTRGGLPTHLATQICPLTGVPALSGQAPDGPALAVKVDNEVRSQSGLFHADLVFEEPIEAGRTRFVAVFQCTLPDLVGPVRGPRPTDPDLLAELGHPLFAFGNDSLAEPLDLSGVVDVSERIEPNGYSRTDAGAPYNLFAKPERLLATRTSAPARPVFTYSAAPPAGVPRRRVVEVPFGTLEWRYDEGLGQYVRYYGSRAHESDGRQLSASNVIIQYVRVRDVSIAGKMWVRARTMGEGNAVVFRDGVGIRGTWSRSSRSRPAMFLDKRGREIMLAPGATWVELVPAPK